MAAETITDETETPPAAAPMPPKKSSGLALVAELVILTCFAVGSGGLFGLMVLANPEPAGQKSEPPAVHGKKAARPPEAIIVRPLPAIVTNLASPQKTWVRMEAAVVVGDPAADSNAMAAAIAEDVVAFLRTVPITQLEGSSGFLHLREDLNDRARIRSGGKVRELVIQSLVLE
jgi:flagellar FliL protein